MFLVYIMAMISILASFTVAERTRGDAAALNIAGSLRMQTYRILNTLHELRFDLEKDSVSLNAKLSHALDDFTDRLKQPDLIRAMKKATDQQLVAQHQKIEHLWVHQVMPSLRAENRWDASHFYDQEKTLEALFIEIDSLVSILENNTENKIRLLLFIQFTCLAFAIVIILVSVEDLRKKIAQPLKRLMLLVREASQHNFSIRSELKGEDELSALGQTFDDMATQLSASYANLEARVKQKTLELERSHAALQLLHDASHHLYEHGGDLCRGAVPVLKAVEKLLDIGPTNLYLASDEMPHLTPVMTTQVITRPAYCKDYSCNACLKTDTPDPIPVSEKTKIKLTLPISAGNQQLGTLETHYPQGRVLSDRAIRLLETLTDQIGTAVYLHNKSSERQQLSLLEERTVIARELHDSLAQSLSYLKMQVSRLQKVQQKETVSATQETIIAEIRTGLNNAYAQLRELLTTFRLQLNQPSLKEAIQQTIDEFSKRMQLSIQFDYSLPPSLLSPNEEVHLLQIMREALSNIHKHAQATAIAVELSFVRASVHLLIQDNGVGLKDGKVPENHYGLIIMRDRSMTLGGHLSIENRPEGGVQLHLNFSPVSVKTPSSIMLTPIQPS